jgi:hypothetical protein
MNLDVGSVETGRFLMCLAVTVSDELLRRFG